MTSKFISCHLITRTANKIEDFSKCDFSGEIIQLTDKGKMNINVR
jgi:hypothetical protein